LDFSFIVKEVIVFNLSDFVDSSFLRDIRGCRRSRLKFISLNLAIDLFRLFLTLLSQIVSKINFNSGSGTRSKIIG
jgi:hypothetical protein